MTIAPIGAAAVGFCTAAFLNWNTIKQTNKPASGVKALVVESSPKPNPSVRVIKPIPASYQGKVFEDVRVPPTEKVIALTFDDGPLPGVTQKVLKILKDNKIKATFFLIGRNVQLHPEIVKMVFQDGHVIGNHSWSHPYNRHTLAGSAAEIDRTTDAIAKIIGSKPNLFRPPGGLMHTGLVDYAMSEKMGIVIWSADSQDYRAHNSPQRILNNMLKEIKPGGIVLMHDGGSRRTNTVTALPILIATLRKQGYRFVTLPELINLGSKKSTVVESKPKMATTAKF